MTEEKQPPTKVFMQAGLTLRTSALIRYSAFVSADTALLYFYL